VLGDERHDGVNQSQSAIESSVQGLLGRLSALGGSIFGQEELGVLDENIAQLAVPVLVGGNGDAGELTGLEGFIDLLGSSIELVENPALRQGLLPSFGCSGLRLEVLAQLAKNELGSLVNLVTEATVSVNDLDIECNITTF
jgi:hypothetical protein